MLLDYGRIKSVIGDPDENLCRTFPSILDYTLQCRTVEMRVPRQSGKTRFIASNAKCGDLIICGNLGAERYFFDAFGVRAYVIDQLENRLFGSYSRGRHALYDIKNYPTTIWLDEVEISYRVCVILERVICSSRQSVISLHTSPVR